MREYRILANLPHTPGSGCSLADPLQGPAILPGLTQLPQHGSQPQLGKKGWVSQENHPACRRGTQPALALTVNPSCCSQLSSQRPEQLVTGLLLQRAECQSVSGHGASLSWTLLM